MLLKKFAQQEDLLRKRLRTLINEASEQAAKNIERSRRT